MIPEQKWYLIRKVKSLGVKFFCPECENEYLLIADYTEPCFRCYSCFTSEIPGIDFYDRLILFLKEN